MSIIFCCTQDYKRDRRISPQFPEVKIKFVEFSVSLNFSIFVRTDLATFSKQNVKRMISEKNKNGRYIERVCETRQVEKETKMDVSNLSL